MNAVKASVRLVARKLFGDYQLNRMYRLERPPTPPPMAAHRRIVQLGQAGVSEIRAHADPPMRKSVGFAGPGVVALGLREHGLLTTVAFFADREAFYNENVWPLKRGKARLVELVTLPEHRGKDLEPLLIMHA